MEIINKYDIINPSGLRSGDLSKGGLLMNTLKEARNHFATRKFDAEKYSIGHLSDEVAKLYARDLFLIGSEKESEILSGNDMSRYTAIVNKISGKACDVFFDIAAEPKIDPKSETTNKCLKRSEIVQSTPSV
jgi:hypothetical protein